MGPRTWEGLLLALLEDFTATGIAVAVAMMRRAPARKRRRRHVRVLDGGFGFGDSVLMAIRADGVGIRRP